MELKVKMPWKEITIFLLGLVVGMVVF